jgi:hypothetical protein
MKHAFFYGLLLTLFVSCKSNTKNPSQDSLKSTPAIDPTSKLMAEFKPIVHGVWVKTDYVDKVIRTKSPLAAADLATGVTTMYINTNNIAGDSIIVPAGWGNHEGGELTLAFKAGKRKSTIKFGAGDLGYSIKNGDTILTTYWPDDNKKIIVTNYKRALYKQLDDDIGYGLNYMINKGMIAGKYSCIDTSGVASPVIFTNNGKVTGLDNFKTYFIQNDLGGEPMNNLDGIIFDIYTKKNTGFSYQINIDTLKLYSTRPNADSTLLILDKLKYTLIKQK